LFGANNIAGRVIIAVEGVEQRMKWKLAFYSGGVGTFLMAFMQLMRARRQHFVHAEEVQSSSLFFFLFVLFFIVKR